MPSQSCSLCGNSPRATSWAYGPTGGARDASRVDCETCGSYVITGRQEVNSRRLSQEDRYRLSAITRNATERGEIVELTTENEQQLLDSTRSASPPEQAEMLLANIASKSNPPGKSVPLNPKTDYPLVCAMGPEGLQFVAKALVHSNLIHPTGPDESGIPNYQITMAGYAQLDAKRKRKAEAEQAAPDIDGPTGLLRREVFDRDVTEMAEDLTSNRLPLALIMVDIDHFKEVNDTYGHPKGDAVLKGVAERVASAAKGKGRVYRYGGDEMAVVLPNHASHEALALAERVRRALDSVPVADVKVTASFGVACIPDHGADPEQLKQAADRALYDAKERGRNCVRVYGEGPPLPGSP